MSKYFKAKIINNKSLNNKDLKLITISHSSEMLIPRPGQFYMLQVSSTYDPLLKRPFSVFKYSGNTLKFLYKIKGRGTSCLSNFKRGDSIYAIGPLGNGFVAPEGDFIVVAGGVGIAPLLPLMQKYKGRAYFFYGSKNKDELVMINEAKVVSKEVFITTDDGSEEKKGLITDVLEKFLSNNSSFITHCCLYACGSAEMLKKLSKIVASCKIKCCASLEEHMACGVGACAGCVVRTQNTEYRGQGSELIYKRICKEGPVFDLKGIVWE